jgi:hypothetical protein
LSGVDGETIDEKRMDEKLLGEISGSIYDLGAKAGRSLAREATAVHEPVRTNEALVILLNSRIPDAGRPAGSHMMGLGWTLTQPVQS